MSSRFSGGGWWIAQLKVSAWTWKNQACTQPRTDHPAGKVAKLLWDDDDEIRTWVLQNRYVLTIHVHERHYNWLMTMNQWYEYHGIYVQCFIERLHGIVWYEAMKIGHDQPTIGSFHSFSTGWNPRKVIVVKTFINGNSRILKWRYCTI
jgi:hypothetical protein